MLQILVMSPILGRKHYRRRDFCLFCSLLYPWLSEQVLALKAVAYVFIDCHIFFFFFFFGRTARHAGS